MTDQALITIAIIEDQQEVADSLKTIIDEEPGFLLQNVYLSAEEALQDSLAKKNITVFLVDLGLPGLDGISFIKRAKELCPQSQFMVHTISESGDRLWSALAAGAIGYVLKGCHRKDIIDSIRIVARGNTLLSPRMAGKLIRFFNSITGPANPLTKREIEILQELKAGNTYEEIAASNFLSPHTVHTHIKNIYKKLRVNNKTDAVKKALVFHLLTS